MLNQLLGNDLSNDSRLLWLSEASETLESMANAYKTLHEAEYTCAVLRAAIRNLAIRMDVVSSGLGTDGMATEERGPVVVKTDTPAVPAAGNSDISPVAPDGRCCATCKHQEWMHGHPVCALARTKGIGANVCQGPNRDQFTYWEAK